MYNSHYQ